MTTSVDQVITVKKEFFDLIESGQKTVEIRLATPELRKSVKAGTIIKFINNKVCRRKVTRVTIYTSLEDMIDSEDNRKIHPTAEPEEILSRLQEIYDTQRVRKHGIVAWELIPVS